MSLKVRSLSDALLRRHRSPFICSSHASVWPPHDRQVAQYQDEAFSAANSADGFALTNASIFARSTFAVRSLP